MKNIMAQLTAGDIIGLSIIVAGNCLCLASVIWAVKSKCRSLGPMALSWGAAFLCWTGTAIAHFL